MIDGLQGAPTGPVKQYEPDKNNTPPWVSYMLDVETTNTDQSLATDDPLQWSDITTQGWMGDVAILRGCGGGIADAGGAGSGGGYYGWPTSYPYWTTTTGGGDPDNPPPPPPICIIGVNCPPPPPPKACAKVEGKFACDPKTGEYAFNGSVTFGSGFNFDAVKYSNTAPGHVVAGGPITSTGPFSISGAVSGQTLGADLCLFNKAEMASGKPFACCKIIFDEPAPLQSCKKAQ